MSHCVHIRPAATDDEAGLIQLIAAFRQSLAALRGKSSPLNLASAREELQEYIEKGFPIFVAESAPHSLVGYIVCRVDGEVVWAESLYVMPEYRRRGTGSALFAEAERLAQELGGDHPYNWVDPNNDKIIQFLKKRGYTILNLIELRHPQPGETVTQKIRAGQHEFDQCR